ncbi:RNA polymerase sigma-70 factor, ECF subfamily [Flexibacter flexilis DSM 6793]|uniref:RNA polymerase sigma-70 factor, ECF subfamily n=1 Tax=Flexibacter flexilis DSM 6793 TaxID=927664 RepID=A0A1I1HFS9_9BACT|nr:sigma-70 family RNA polymerase sigma factor [Flexibacter flexilis]SFC20323.1 RNA polymerase sigma-70 factor, ECF subfamily [Flexibacter flexilis DSM 6793]
MDATLTDKTLVEGCIAGNNAAREALYKLYYGKMLSLCLRYTQNRDQARDLMHEGFLKVFESIGMFKSEGSLEGWIRRIMVNIAIAHYHKQNKLRLTHSAITETDEDDHHTETALISDDDIVAKISYEELLQLIRGLPAAYQTVFNLYAIEGYTHKEIAEMLQISEGASKSNLFKARAKLQQQVTQLLNTQDSYNNVQ